MAKPLKEIHNDTYEQIVDDLYYYLASLSKPELLNFLNGIFTDSEIRMMHRRWHIAVLSSSGLDFREVANIADVSTGTVMSVKKTMLSDNESITQALTYFKNKKKEELVSDNETVV